MSNHKSRQLPETLFVNEFRLAARHWVYVLGFVLLGVFLTPRLWTKIERFVTGPDYRLPYPLSKDYWLYERRLRGIADPAKIVVLGDSVVWGEYVLPDGTLSHFLNQEAGRSDQFINGGVNGLFPLALEGLIRYHGQPLHHRKILLQCNVLWMSSPKADLRVDKEEKFNHAHLVPQFVPRIPCYKADATERLSLVIERNLNFMAWVNHLQSAYFGDRSIPLWTLEADSTEPPQYPNAYKNPFAQITLTVPSAPPEDSQRGPRSPRHKPWTETVKGATQFEWVDPETSLQWGAFRRLVENLRARGNQVLVVLGPFNEHMIAQGNRLAYQRLGTDIIAWFKQSRVLYVAPETLPGELYADASHPLTGGYELLAKRLYQDADFQKWLKN